MSGQGNQPPPQGNPGVINNPPPPVPIFSLTPAELHANNFVNMGSPEGRKLFSTATKPLDDPFDGKQAGLNMFIHQVSTRASLCGWSTILSIPVPNGNAPVSLLTHAGQISYTDIVAHSASYQGTQSKAAQDAIAMKMFLDSSLSKNLMMRVLARKDKYVINGIANGPAMFFQILNIVGIETGATVAVINAILRKMPDKIKEVHYDIVKFNEFVVEQCNELTSRGEVPHDILHLLFDAYRTVTNSEFTEYIRAKKNSVLDRSLIIEYQALMTLAEEKYKIMVIRGDWKKHKSAPTADEHIVALQAQVLALQTATQAPKRSTSNRTSNAASANTDRRNNNGKWAWKDVAPKANESHTKTFEDKKYVYCPNHDSTKWVLADKHKDGCKLDPNWKFPIDGNQKGKKKAEEGTELTYKQAMMTIIDAADNDEEDEEV